MTLASQRRKSREGQGLQWTWSLFPEHSSSGAVETEGSVQALLQAGHLAGFHSTSLRYVSISLPSRDSRWHV